jgi:DNA topoisomerase-1
MLARFSLLVAHRILRYNRPAICWREKIALKWTTLRHNGVAFPPEYDYRGLTIKIKNERVKLTPEQEEMLMAWAKKKDTPYVLDPVFQKNFLGDLKTKLDARFADITLDDIDFTELHAIAEREKTANLSAEERKQRSAQRKREREELKAKYGIAIIDGKETEVGAYLVEPPGILMGRGNHPLRGRWKERVQPEDVTLNLDEEAPIPPAPPGHHWKEIVHEHDSMWLASWYDKLSDKRKYIWLADSADLRQARDQEKYIQAAKLEKHVGKVRAEIAKRMTFEDKGARAELEKTRQALHAKRQAIETRLLEATQAGDAQTRKKLENALDRLRLAEEKLAKREARIHVEEMKTRQLATVCYLIDRLAMRVGDEKDEDEADTVGASTLRVEHVHISDKEIQFDFLGKDSVQWQKSLPLAGDDLVLARNLQDLARGKQPGDQLFDKIDSTHVNRFLGSIVEGLTAKVFRTYHATHAVRTALLRDGNLAPETPSYRKEYVAKLANLEAAIVCNHKRTPPKTWQESLAKREQEVERLRAAQPDVSRWQAQIAAREKALEKLLAAKPDLEKLQARVKACEDALAQARAAQAALPNFDELIQAKQAALDQALAEQQKIQAAAQETLKKKQAALEVLIAKKPPKAKKALAEYHKRLRAARQAIAATKKSNEEKIKRAKARVISARRALDAALKAKHDQPRRAAKRIAQAEAALKRAQETLTQEPQRYEERVAKARQALEQAQQAPLLAQKNYAERVERATLQLDLAKRTRDYNLGTSLKNYIDPSVYKLWGDHVGFDWKRLYTKALQRKFAWVEKVRGKWKEQDLEG